MTLETPTQSEEDHELTVGETRRYAEKLLSSVDEALLNNPEFTAAAARSFLEYEGGTGTNEASFQTFEKDTGKTTERAYVVYRDRGKVLGRKFNGIALFLRELVSTNRELFLDNIWFRVDLSNYGSEIRYGSTREHNGNEAGSESFRNTHSAVDKIKSAIGKIASS